MKSVFITGAGTGMGKAYVDLLANKGWLVFAGVMADNPENKEWQQNSNIHALVCDVTKPNEIAKIADIVAEKTNKKLDLLINNAGAGLACGAVEAPYLDAARISMEVNYWGLINMVQGFIPLVKNAGGRILNVSSPASYLTMPFGFAYCTSKTAAKSLSAHMRMELAVFGVQVTNLEPGGVESQMIKDGRDAEQTWGPMPEHLRDTYKAHFMSGLEGMADVVKFIPPEEFAEQVYKKVIVKKKWKANYRVGPGSLTIALLNKLLPEALNEALWRHVFKRK